VGGRRAEARAAKRLKRSRFAFCSAQFLLEIRTEGNVADKQTQERANESNTVKHPDDWTTGDEPMTAAQRSYLHTLAEEAGVQVDDELTKAEASKKIDELQTVTGRGKE
jgi:hypothetical protein